MRRLSQPTSVPERPVFAGFDVAEPGKIAGYERNLPHLRIDGATYFVTFRLADSIPEPIALAWRLQREDWLRASGINPAWEMKDPARWKQAYFGIAAEHRMTFERNQNRKFFIELDRCHGSCALQENHAMVAAALEYFHGQRLWTGDYVVMPNHVHAIVQPFPGVKLEDWLYSVKRFTSARMKAPISSGSETISGKSEGWQDESFDRIVRNAAELARTRKYIGENPVHLRPETFSYKRMPWLDEFA